MRKLFSFISSSAFLLLVFGCGQTATHKNRGEIVFGDSASIVTENDPRYLSNNVTDFVPQKPIVAEQAAAETTVAIDTPKPAAEKPLAEPITNTSPSPVKGNGLQAPFEHLNITINDVKGRTPKNIDWNKAKGASFTLEQGELSGKSLTISGANVLKVQQRYQTVVLLKAGDGKAFKLSALPVSTSEWKPLKGNKGKYLISGIGGSDLRYDERFSPNALRNAAQRLARANRMSKREEEKMIKSLRTVRNARQAPLSIALQSVVWKITATEPSGKTIERELRIDINR